MSVAAPHSADFFDGLRQLLGQLKGTGNIELRVACLLDCARYFYVAGDSHRGISAAREAHYLSSKARHSALTRKSLTFLGNLLADTGALAEAIERLVEAALLSKKLVDEEGWVSSLIGMGVALFYSSQYEDAIACLEHAERKSRGVPSLRAHLGGALTTKSLCLLHLNRVHEGLVAAEQAIEELPSPRSGSEVLSRLVRECNYVHLLLEVERIDDANVRLQFIKDLALQAGSQKALVLSKIVSGLVEIEIGDAALGMELLADAHSEAGSVHSLVQEALVALVRGHAALGHHKDALACLRVLLQRLSAARQECALLHLNSILATDLKRKSDSDLHALKHKEALLRAKVAEDQLTWSKIEMLERLAVTADLREEASGAHGYRVGRLSAALAEEMGMDSETCLMIDLAARLHDIGKMGVPDRILLTSDALKEAERHFMCSHTVMGAELLSNSNVPQLRLAEEIAHYHHEWWDGSGYPKGLAGKRIPIHARIVALADVFDALTHGRPYAEPWPIDRALEEIAARSGTQFDPDLTGRFVALVGRLRAEHKNLDEYLARAGRNSPFLQARRKIKKMLEQEREHERKATDPGNRTRH